MRHECISLPKTGVVLETYLTDNRAVEDTRRRPLALIFPGGAYAYRSDREAEPVALRLLGLGVQAPNASWGLMINAGRQYLYSAPWLCFVPGIAIMIVVLAFNFLGDGLRDVLDPHQSE